MGLYLLDDGECIPLSGGLVLQSTVSRSWSGTNTLAFLRAVVSLGLVLPSPDCGASICKTLHAYINGNLMYGVRAGSALGHIAGVANALVDRV